MEQRSLFFHLLIILIPRNLAKAFTCPTNESRTLWKLLKYCGISLKIIEALEKAHDREL